MKSAQGLPGLSARPIEVVAVRMRSVFILGQGPGLKSKLRIDDVGGFDDGFF